MSNELVVIENIELAPFFTKGDNLDSILERIEKEAMSFVHGDLSVKKNRDAVKAIVTKVTKSKTYLESQGKDLAAEYKEIPKRIDSNRKKTKDFLTEVAARVRKPLTEWEEAEKQRIADELAAKEKQDRIDAIDADYEFAQLLMKTDFDEREAARLQAIEDQRIADELAKQQRIEREEQIRKDAEEKAKLEAVAREEQLKRDAEEAKQREEQAKLDAIAAEEREKVRAEQEEIRRVADAEAAEKKRLADIEAAKQAEIKRQKDELDRQAAEQAKREANTKHIGSVRKAAKESIMALGIDEDTAKSIVMAIHKGEIANVKINY